MKLTVAESIERRQLMPGVGPTHGRSVEADQDAAKGRAWVRHGLLAIAVLAAAEVPAGCRRAEQGPAFTRAVFEAIPEGSTTEEVRRKLGTPFTTIVTESGGRGEQHWWYGRRPVGGAVEYSFPTMTFVDGKLRSRAWDEAAQEPQRKRKVVPGVTRALFEAIPLGSTTALVRRQIGPPFKEVIAVRVDNSEEVYWCYGMRTAETRAEYSFPMMTFVEGRLQSRAWDEAAQDAQRFREMEESEAKRAGVDRGAAQQGDEADKP